MKAILRSRFLALAMMLALPVPAHADHKKSDGIVSVEPFFVPVSERPSLQRWRQQDGYPVALIRQRLREIGFSGIGQFDVYPGAYGVDATDPGGVRVNLVIDRWSGDTVRARVIEAGPAARPFRSPAMVDGRSVTTPKMNRKSAALRAPSLARPAPERLTQTAGIAPLAAADLLDREIIPPATVQGENIVTSSINRPEAVLESHPIGQPTPMPEPLAEALPPEPEAPVEITAAPKLPVLAGAGPVSEAVAHAPIPARQDSAFSTSKAPTTALQGKRFDPAGERDPIAEAHAASKLIAKVDISQQTMSVIKNGRVIRRWPVSTGRKRYRTPVGSYRPTRMHVYWESRKYHRSPMPHSIFFQGGYAIHGTNEVRNLGRIASHGCIRLHPVNAKELFYLVKASGQSNTRIIVHY